MRVERFPSVENYADQVERQMALSKSRSYGSYDYYGSSYGGPSQGQSWDAGVGYAQAIQLAKKGDPLLVSKSSDQLDRLVNEYKLREEVRTSYKRSVMGTRVNVPEYLSGSPLCMRRKQASEMQVRSVSIYVSTTCAAGITADQMLKRGSTIMALLEYLQMSQVAVQLYLLAETHGATDGDFIQVIQVESSPLDLSTASFAIAHPAFARQITYAMAYAMDRFNGQWPRSRGYGGTSDAWEKLLSSAIGMTADDIYVPAPSWYDEEIIARPEQWLDAKIRKIKGSINESV